MAFEDYTNPDSIRAILGVNAKELKDIVVTDNVFYTAMLEALHDIDAVLAADYLVAKAAEPPSATQGRFVMLTDAYCAYFVAQLMIPKLPVIAPQLITDGRSQVQRVDNPFATLLPAINASLTVFKDRLIAVYKLINTGVVVPAARAHARIAAVSLGTDPVTG